MSILSPWFAMMMTVPWGYRKESKCSETCYVLTWKEGIGCLEEQSGVSCTTARAWMHLVVLFLHRHLGFFSPQNKGFKQAAVEPLSLPYQILSACKQNCYLLWRHACSKGSCHVCLPWGGKMLPPSLGMSQEGPCSSWTANVGTEGQLRACSLSQVITATPSTPVACWTALESCRCCQDWQDPKEELEGETNLLSSTIY